MIFLMELHTIREIFIASFSRSTYKFYSNIIDNESYPTY